VKSVAICGSRRFKPGIRSFAAELKNAGVVVYEPFLHSGVDEWDRLSDDYKRFVALGLTLDHFYKIKMADVVFIYNQEGYAGPSTTLELGCAVALGKTVYAFSDKDPEICRTVLIHGFFDNAQDFLKALK
jgi:nucleoside 2-deoxyribosyltransferase